DRSEDLWAEQTAFHPRPFDLVVPRGSELFLDEFDDLCRTSPRTIPEMPSIPDDLDERRVSNSGVRRHQRRARDPRRRNYHPIEGVDQAFQQRELLRLREIE